MYSVELYARVRHTCHVEGMSIREAARAFGVHGTQCARCYGFGEALTKVNRHAHVGSLLTTPPATGSF